MQTQIVKRKNWLVRKNGGAWKLAKVPAHLSPESVLVYLWHRGYKGLSVGKIASRNG